MAGASFQTNPIDLYRLLDECHPRRQSPTSSWTAYLQPHLIDSVLLRANKFEAFMENRQKRLLLYFLAVGT